MRLMKQTKITKTSITIDLQLASQAQHIPPISSFQQWAEIALTDFCNLRSPTSLCIRIVDEAEIAELNHQYRHKQGPTNVLSFPSDIPAELVSAQDYLGDIIICAPIVEREAITQAIPILAHWAHMTVHGILHLLGYDHIVEQDAKVMESFETQILIHLGFNNPYGE